MGRGLQLRVLFIVPYAPSLIRVRPYQLIRALARRGHRVLLATLWTNSDERSSLEELASENIVIRSRRLPAWRPLWNCLCALPTRIPLQAAYCWQPELALEVKRAFLESQFDIIHVEHLRGVCYGLRIKRLLVKGRRNVRGIPKRIPVIWDSVDCISYLFQQARYQSRSMKGRWMTRLELSKTKAYEGWLVRQFDHVLATSPTDCRALQNLAGESDPHASGSFLRRARTGGPRNVRVLSNGVDLEYFAPADEPRDPSTLVLTGKMSYHANVTTARHLVDEIMPLIWAHRPDVKLIIAGKDPPREVRSLASESPFPKSNGKGSGQAALGRVIVTDTVPDIRPYLFRATLAVAPVPYAVGIQNKVLEAMACGTPVVASPKAVQGLSAQAGRDLRIAEGAGSFAREVLALLENRAVREAIGQAGRSYVEAHHNWDTIAASLEAIYMETLTSRNRDNTSEYN